MLYAIGDLHLAKSTDKSMEVFGAGWSGYMDRLQTGFSGLKPEDTCVLCGDLSWSMSLENAAADFHFVDDLPGKKIVLKGNHDYWWATAAKIEAFFRQEGIRSIEILNNNSYRVGNTAICGTRGWFFEEETGDAHDKKILNRELMRLEASLKSAGDAERRICFLHYPPRYHQYICREMLNIMTRYEVTDCYYGHLHGSAHRFAVTGPVEGIRYHNVSADHVNFTPVPVE